jgi:uncharacterized protein YkwD
LAALLAALLAGCVHAPAQQDPAFSRTVSLDYPDRALLAAAIFSETNRVRASNGVPPLERLPELQSAADEQAMHMALTLRAEHSNPIPGEQTVADRIGSAGFKAAHVAENAIMWPARPPAGSGDGPYTYSGLAAALLQSWMDSPGHRLNLLDPENTYFGCSARFARDGLGNTMVFAVQVFALPASAGAVPK